MNIAGELIRLSQFPVLDAGCGLGRNAAALAARGLSVVCADHNPRRLQTLVRVAPTHLESMRSDVRKGQLYPLLTNLNQAKWPFSKNCFGAIICVHFLDTDLFDAFHSSLVTGGLLYIETFGGHGENYLDLPKAGQLSDLLSRYFPFIESERLAGYKAVSVKLLAEKV
jgi:SAM-dependent methyltransferase